jgi:dTDP-4-dehydrorhamnose reductase
MKILLLGSGGQVGWEIARQAKDLPMDLTSLNRNELDVTNIQELIDAINKRAPDIVVNATAYTAVDQAEKDADKAYAVNRDAPADMAMLCHEAHIPLIHLSTDYIFDGTKSEPYQENDPANPLGVYGKSKWEGEEVVRGQLQEHIILRTSWIFGIHGSNFVKTILRLAREREQLQVVGDQTGCPTFAGDIAKTILVLCQKYQEHQQLSWGTYHYCGTPMTTWYDFSQTIVKQARQITDLKVQEIISIPTSGYPTPANRPMNSALKCDKISRQLAIQQTNWIHGLKQCLQPLRES